MATRLLARLLVPVLVAAVSGLVAAPARACACGALLSNDPRLSVSGETSIVRWDGAHEEITLRLTVASSRADAALLLPTPAPATVRRGDATAFSLLAALSESRYRVTDDWWPSRLFDPGVTADAPAARGPDVTVHGETNVGPYHVASLSARDPEALARWLSANGYRLKGKVASELAPYVKMGWRYTAIKLRAGGALTGELSPLRFGFAAKSPVYPMRLSHAITADQHVRLYVLAPHRMAVRSGGIPFVTSYAGRYDGPADPTLFAHGTTFVTTLNGTAVPGRVTGDIRLAPVADTPYRYTFTTVQPVYILGVAGGPFLVGLGLLVVLGAAVIVPLIVRRERRSRAGTSVMPQVR